jgi:glycosyltransferase involved in cell wall biosynthesis
VHAGNPPAPLAGQIYARRFDVPLVLTYHGDPQAGYGSALRRAGVLSWILVLKKLLIDADAILCPSGAFLPTSRYLRSHLSQVQVIPNGIDPAEYEWPESREDSRRALGLPENKPIVLFLGSLSPYKSPDLVLKAAAVYPKWGPDAQWVLAGSGSMESKLQMLARELGVVDRVHFLGFITGEQKLRALRAADVFVLPSTMTTEVFPIVLLEAGAFGLPAVVSDLPTFEAIIEHGRNGLIVPGGHVEELANTIAQILANTAAHTDMAHEAQLGIAQYTWTSIAETHERVYRRLLSGEEDPCLSA